MPGREGRGRKGKAVKWFCILESVCGRLMGVLGGRGGEGSPWEAPGFRPELHSASWAAGPEEGEEVKGALPV